VKQQKFQIYFTLEVSLTTNEKIIILQKILTIHWKHPIYKQISKLPPFELEKDCRHIRLDTKNIEKFRLKIAYPKLTVNILKLIHVHVTV
jgi:hypothetical protein